MVAILSAVGILFLSSLSTVVGYQTVKETMKKNLIEQSEDSSLEGLGEMFNRVDLLKHPFLFFIIYILAQFRLNRGWFLYEISTSIGAFNWVDIAHPVLFLRSCWLVISTSEWLNFWGRVSYSRGWNWPV
jgi:hypothetical protein